jgi:hypothetical protein
MDNVLRWTKMFTTAYFLVGLLLGFSFIAAGQATKPRGSSTNTQKPATQTTAAQTTAFVPSSLVSVHRLEQQIASARARGLKEWNYRDAHLFWLRQRAYPNDTVDWKAYTAAFVQRALMPFAEFRLASGHGPGLRPVAQPQWEFLGPRNLPVPYQQFYGQGSTSGRVNGVAFDPSADGVIYVASAGGGAWKRKKSSDSTWTWMPLSDSWKNLKTSSVAVDPSRPQRIYVGTGDFDGGLSEYGYGVQRSTNGGNDWTLVASTELKGLSVRRILIDPRTPDIITVAAGRNSSAAPGKLLRSENGGDNWQEVLPSTIPGVKPADWEDLKCGIKDSQGKRWCYAVGASDGGEVIRTKDQGRHWQKTRPPLSSYYQQSLAVATSQTDPETVYLLSGTDELILKSDSHGDRWESITRAFPSCLDDRSDYNWSQSDYDFYIETALNPQTNQDIIYIGLIDIVASIDGGQSWKSVGKTYQTDALTHNDQHTLVVNPQKPNEFLVGNDGGVYGVTFDPAATTWSFQTDLNADLGLTQFYRIAADPKDSSILVGGAQDNASPLSTGDLKNWKNVGGGDGGFSAVSSSATKIQYATEQRLGIYRTTDQWANWNVDNAGCTANPTDCAITYTETINGSQVPWGGDAVGFIAPIVLDPNNQNLLYVGTTYLWSWDGTSWSKHLGDRLLTQPGDPRVSPAYWDTIATVTVAPSDSKRIYTGSQTGQIWMSTSAGASGSWKRIDTTSSGLPSFSITDIAVHPTNPDTILISYSGTAGKNGPHPGHVWKCTNTSSASPHCENISRSPAGGLPNIPANTILIDPKSPSLVYYVGTDVGVFVTKTGGSTWADFGDTLGLPNVQVNHLLLQGDSDYLLAATFGRGIWQIKLPTQPNAAFPEMLIQRRVTVPTSHKSNANKGSRPS